MKRIYQRIFEHAKPYLRTRQNLIHTRIVFRYALKLLKMESEVFLGDRFIIWGCNGLESIWDGTKDDLPVCGLGVTPVPPAQQAYSFVPFFPEKGRGLIRT